MKRYQKTLERLLGSLRNDSGPPAGYALLDGDQTVPQENPENPQRHIAFIKLACRESENLFLTTTLLTELGTDWPSAMRKIKQESHNYGQKQPILDGCDSWDRKNSEEIKTVIHELTEILDPKKVHWTMRVAKCIGAQRPTGELVDFLGQNVVEALWGSETGQSNPSP